MEWYPRRTSKGNEEMESFPEIRQGFPSCISVNKEKIEYLRRRIVNVLIPQDDKATISSIHRSSLSISDEPIIITVSQDPCSFDPSAAFLAQRRFGNYIS